MTQRLLLVLIALLIAATAFTQPNPTPPNQQDLQVAASSNLITLHVIVTDRDGHYVEGLTPDQFEIYDNNVKQQITHFNIDDSPVSIGIVYQVNENDTERLTGVLNALNQFVSTLKSDDDFFFVAFNKRGSVTTATIPSHAQVLDYLQFVSVGDPFSVYDGIYFAFERLNQSPHLKKALLVISDATDDGSINSYSKLRTRLTRLNTQIYVLGLTETNADTVSPWFFEDVTRASGRRSFLQDADTGLGAFVLQEMRRASEGSSFPDAESESELAGICTQIAVELRRQYTLGFYSSATDGNKWHTLRVRLLDTRRRGFILSYREGYVSE